MAGELDVTGAIANLGKTVEKTQKNITKTVKPAAPVQQDPVEAKITELFGAEAGPTGAGVRTGATTRGIAEYQLRKYAAGGTPEEKQARKALSSSTWATASPEVQKVAFSQAKSVLGDQTLPWSPAFTKYPSLALSAAKALNNGQLTRQQMQTVRDAVDIIDTAITIINAASPTTQERLWSKLSEPQKIAVRTAGIAIGEEWQKEMQARVADAAREPNPIIGALGLAGGAVMDSLMWLSEKGENAKRAALYTITEGTGPLGIVDAWRDTSTGKIDSVSFARLQNEFGEKRVNVVRDALMAINGTNGFDYGDLVAKYELDDEALQMIDEVFIDSERTPEMTQLLGNVDSTRRDDLGNMVANVFFQGSLKDERGNNPIYTVLDKGVNAASMLLLDPTLLAGKAYKASQTFKYGLVRNFGAGTLEKSFARPAVQRFFTAVGDDIVRLNDTKDLASRGMVYNDLSTKYGKYLTRDAIDSLASYAKTGGKIKDPQALVRNWVMEMNGFEKILLGQPARTADDVLLPRMSAFRAKNIERYLQLKKAITFDDDGAAFLDDVFGTNPDGTLREMSRMELSDQAAAIAETFTSPGMQDILAAEFGVTKTLAKVGDAFEDYGVNPDKVAVFGDRARKSYRYSGFPTSVNAWRNRTDRFLRNLELMPRGRVINIRDASDADKIYQWSRTTMSRYGASLMREAWVNADEGARRLMLDGIFRTIAAAKGVPSDKIQDIMVSSSKATEQYAVTQAALMSPDAIDGVDNIDELVSWSDRATRSVMPNLSTAQQRRINAINAKISEKIAERNALRAEISSRSVELRGREDAAKVFSTDQQLRTLIDDLTKQLEGLRKQRGAQWFEGKQLLEERKRLEETVGAYAYNPAEVGNRQHALHVWQTADSVVVPDYGAIQQFSAKVGVLNKMIGWTWRPGVTKTVDIWSMGNLYGPRYVARGGIEDLLGYAASGGSLMSLVTGRKLSIALREARGKKLGFVNEQLRTFSDNNSVIGRFLLQHLNADDVAKAKIAADKGDLKALQELAAKAVARQRVGITGKILNDVDEEFFNIWAKRDTSLRTLDDIAEVRGDLNSARLTDDAMNYMQMRADLRDMRVKQVGEYTQIKFTDPDMDAFLLWEMNLGNILSKDGRPAQIVFNAIRSHANRTGLVEKAKERAMPKLVEFLESEAGQAWASRFSIFAEEGMTVQRFAARYFDDTAWYMSNGRGVINKDLVHRLTRTDAKTGAKYGAMYEVGEGGSRIAETAVTADDLRKYGTFDRPEYVLGRAERFIGVTNDINWMDKAWQGLSESLARISREPIFFARATDEYRTLQPMVNGLIESGVSESAAKEMVVDLASRRAEMLTLSYIDNPEVRTAMSWNARNVARYFRATEDFYRRAARLAKFYPESIQKANLAYHAIEHSGFIWKDDQDQQYFMYPGTAILNTAVQKGLSVLGLGAPGITNPFGFAGQTLMLTPSADPSSLLPTFASPFAAIPLKIITAMPFAESFEAMLLGERAAKPTTDLRSLLGEIASSMVPSHALRVYGALDSNERNSQYASAMKSAFAILAYNGELDGPKDGESTDGYQARMMEQVSNIATSTLVLRAALGFVLPASPQTTTLDDITGEARQAGIKSLRRGYTELLSKFDGDIDRATAAWFKINPNLMPFTVSSTEATGQAYPGTGVEALKWMEKNSDFLKRHSSAAPFIMPRSGELSFGAYTLVKANNLIQGKATSGVFLDVATANDYYVYSQTKKDYEAALDAAGSVAGRRAETEKWNAIQEELYAQNPFLKTRVQNLSSKSTKAVKERALEGVRVALDEVYSSKKDLRSDTTFKLGTMIATFDDGMIDLDRYQGTSTFAENKRAEIRGNLRGLLQDVAGDDANAKMFFDYILDDLIGGK